MRESTLCFLQNTGPEQELLFGFKKMGFGAGKYAGIGGKVEAGETVVEAAIREVQEEIGVTIQAEDLRCMGELTFVFPFKAQWSQKVSVFVARKWTGEPVESDEMVPAWFRPAEIPYPSMWQDAAVWLPYILRGDSIRATFSFMDDNETVESVQIAGG